MLSSFPDQSTWESARRGDDGWRQFVPPFAAAVVCGCLTLFSGFTALLLWLVTGWTGLFLGGITILLGVLLFTLAIVIAGTYAIVNRSATWARAWFVPAACILLLFSNFAVAVVAAKIETRYVIVIHNASSQPLDEVRVFGGGSDVAIGSIPPGDSATRSLWFDRDGTFEFEGKLGGKPVSTTVEGYVTNGAGGRGEVTVDDRGASAVSQIWDD